MITVAVLGAVEARRDGVRLDVPRGKTTELLARLALDAGTLIRADVLLDDLWAHPAARNTLQSKVSQLRRAIGPEVVVGSADAYLLDLPREAVDALRVEDLAALFARSAGDPAASLQVAVEGLALFRADLLLAAGDWAQPHRARLEELRLQLTENAFASRLALGAGGELVAELTSLVERYPLREALWAALITALYRADRQADAMAAYGRVRRVLRDELGAEPGPALRSLELRLLRHSPDLGRGRPRASVAPGNVPPLGSPTVGREPDVAEVTAALGRHRLVTVLGAGGVGKTRLAVEVAAQLAPPGGVWLIRLDAIDAIDAIEAVDTPGAVGRGATLFQLVAETLQLPGGASSLTERLNGAETVLLLDNCEHLLAPVVDLVASGLAAAPRVRVLATSQAPLGLAEEYRHYLEPLSQPESVELFSQRAREARSRLVLDADALAQIDQVCRRLDGLPLAIELAASRLRSLSIGDLARRLDDRFALVSDPSSAQPERRRALSGAIAWSYELLFPDDRRGLWALACFAGSAGLDATEHVLDALGVPAEAVPDTLGRLVDRSLVATDVDVQGGLRYRLLDSIRSFAADRLAESGQAGAAARAHARWYARTAAWCEAHVRSARQADCLAIARAERSNVDAALAWCARLDPRLGQQIANGFGWTWVVLGDGTAGATRLRNAMPAPGSARDLAVQIADEVLLADVERHRAFLAIQQGRGVAAASYATASLEVYRARRLTWSTAASLLLGAFGALMQGDVATAAREAAEAVDLITPIGDAWGLVHGHAMLGAVAQAQHRFDEAGQALEEAAEQSAALGFLGQAALHRASLARVQQRAGNPSADASYRRAIADAVAGGDGRLAATARVNLARLCRAAGDNTEAVALLTDNQRWYAAAGGGDFALLTDCLLAAIGDDPAALTRILHLARAEDNPEAQVLALDGLARLATEQGDPETGWSRLTEADRLAELVAHTLDEQDRIDARLARDRLAAC